MRSRDSDLDRFAASPDLYQMWFDEFKANLRFSTFSMNQRTRKIRLRRLWFESSRSLATYRRYFGFSSEERRIVMKEIFKLPDGCVSLLSRAERKHMREKAIRLGGFEVSERQFRTALAANTLSFFAIAEIQKEFFDDVHADDYHRIHHEVADMFAARTYEAFVHREQEKDRWLEGSMVKPLDEMLSAIEQRALGGADLKYKPSTQQVP